MDDLSRDIWSMLETASSVGMSFLETTITDLLMVGLAQAKTQLGVPLQIMKITQPHEHKIGADVELWLKLDNCNRFLGYSCQAKIVSTRHSPFEYADILYPDKHGPVRPNRRRQYETLIDHAQAVGSIPIHLLYNGWDYAAAPDLNRSSFSMTRNAFQKFGCAAVPTVAVRPSLDSGIKKVAQLAPFMFPWSWLFRDWDWATVMANASSAGSSTERKRAMAIDTDDCQQIDQMVINIHSQTSQPPASNPASHSKPGLDQSPRGAGLDQLPDVIKFMDGYSSYPRERSGLDQLPKSPPEYVEQALMADSNKNDVASDSPKHTPVPTYLVLIGFNE